MSFVKISKNEFSEWADRKFKNWEFKKPVRGKELVIVTPDTAYPSFEYHIYTTLTDEAGNTRDIGKDAIRINLFDIKSAKPVAKTKTAGTKQCVVWTSGDREVALKMAFMYTYNCKKFKWMETVRLLVWGPSSKLLTEDKELQEYVKKMKEMGVELYACKGCADLYGISKQLEALGITVQYTGQMLADMQINGWHVLTL